MSARDDNLKTGASNTTRAWEHAPADMTVTVAAGMTLAALQGELGRRGQWLPVDPPNPERLTMGELIDTNAGGPRRFGYGTIRDYLLGITVALADGRVIHSGGKVVKNVAGYDLAKLFVGGRGSLGAVVEATFKLRPLPERERFAQARCESWQHADKLIETVADSEITPVVFDLHRLHPSDGQACTIVLGLAGTREEVEWQAGRAEALGFRESGSLEYERVFWGEEEIAQKLSVLPSRLIETAGGLKGVPLVARAGNGIIYFRGEPVPDQDKLPLELLSRIKVAFDPNHLLPEMPR
jgi:glycolate oxidase FAD binding subunit